MIKEQQVERRGILLTNFVMELEKKWEKPAEEKNLMKKVIVIGSPGAGKSTFSRKLRAVTGLPLYHLDMIWHKPDRTNISREELVQEQKKIMENRSWIIDKIILAPWNCVWKIAIPSFSWITLWKSVLQEPKPVSAPNGKIFPGWKQNLMKNSVNGSWTFPKTSFPLFTSFLKSMVKTGMSTFSDPETQRKTI